MQSQELDPAPHFAQGANILHGRLRRHSSVIQAHVIGDIIPRSIERAAGRLQEWYQANYCFEELAALGEKDVDFGEFLVREFGERPFWELRHGLKRFEELTSFNAPAIILENEINNIAVSLETLRTKLV